jgi:hypothetical protein
MAVGTGCTHAGVREEQDLLSCAGRGTLLRQHGRQRHDSGGDSGHRAPRRGRDAQPPPVNRRRTAVQCPFGILQFEPRVADVVQPRLRVALQTPGNEPYDRGRRRRRQRVPVRRRQQDRGDVGVCRPTPRISASGNRPTWRRSATSLHRRTRGPARVPRPSRPGRRSSRRWEGSPSRGPEPPA